MKITIEPTPEMCSVKLDGTDVPMRVWNGVTDRGTPILAFVVSVVGDPQALAKELPSFMRPSRETYRIEDFVDERRPR